MRQVQIDEQLFNAVQMRAAEAGYASVDECIADLAVHFLNDPPDSETPDLDHIFTPEKLVELDQISTEIKAGAKTYTAAEVDSHFENKRKEWLKKHAT